MKRDCQKINDMDWYLPITIIPGIGMIILSTTNLLLQLNNEISRLEEQKPFDRECSLIIKDKLHQLKTLSIALVFQYISIFFLLISGVSSLFSLKNVWRIYPLFTGVLMIMLAILLLIKYAFRAVMLRQNHLKIN